jgi:cytoskeletal protein RodZ
MSQLPIDTPGNVLREERKKQGKSLKEISRKLKINIKYLMAVEDDDYSLLPAEVFTKSYLRMYADILGLDSNEILSLYESRNKVEEIQESPSRSSEEFYLKLEGFYMKWKKFYIKLKNYFLPKISLKPLLLVVVIVLIVLSISLIIGDREKVSKTEIINEVQKTEIIEVKKAKQKIVNRAVQKEKKKEEKIVVLREEKKAEQKKDKMLLEIYATELTWVSISIDGGKAEERVLRTGQTATVSALSSFAIKVGNAGGTRMVLDGEDLGSLGPHGKVVDIVLPVGDSKT